MSDVIKSLQTVNLKQETLSNSLPPTSSLAVAETAALALAVTAYLSDPITYSLSWVIGAVLGSIAMNQVANRTIQKEKKGLEELIKGQDFQQLMTQLQGLAQPED